MTARKGQLSSKKRFSFSYLFLFNILDGVLVAGHVALDSHCAERDKQHEDAGNDNPRPPHDTITVLANPFADNIPDDGHADDEGDAHILEEGADEVTADSIARGAEHFANGNLLAALLNEVGGHGDKSQQRDDDGDESKEGDNL